MLPGLANLSAANVLSRIPLKFVVLSVATSESWKNEKGEYDTRTEWHRVYAWGTLVNYAKTLQKGQLVNLEDKIKYRTVVEEVEGTAFKHTIAEIQAPSMRRRTIRQMERTKTCDPPPKRTARKLAFAPHTPKQIRLRGRCPI